jgi:hypothetical protein
MFSKAQIKGEGQPVDEYRELSDKEKLVQAQLYVKSLKKKIDNIEGDAMLYRRLRQLEVIIMAEDGAKYLKGEQLDDYLETFPMGAITRSDLLKELTPALNKAFSDEYAEEHADKLAEHFDREAVRNVKT